MVWQKENHKRTLEIKANHRASAGGQQKQQEYYGKWRTNPTNMEKRRRYSAEYRAKHPVECKLAVMKSKLKHAYPENRNSQPRPTPYTYKPRKCNYADCGKIFIPPNSRVKYCNDTCAYEQQKIQVGEFQARKMQQNRETQRRIKDSLVRAKPPKEAVLQPIHLQDLPVGGKFERQIEKLLGRGLRGI
jgi:hypothetical protein